MFLHFSQSKIRARILLALLSLTLVALLSFVLISFIGMKNLGSYTTELNESLGQEALRVSKNAMQNLARDGLLRTTIDQANLLDAEFKGVESQVNLLCSLNEGWLGHADSAGGATVLAGLLADDPFIASLSLASAGGRYRIISRGSEDSAGYDGSGLDWYSRAVATGRTGWSVPYASPKDREYYISCFRPVYDRRHRMLAVVAANVSLRSINEKILRTQINSQGVAILLDRNRKVIAKAGSAAGERTAEGEYFRLDAEGEERRRLEEALLAGKSGIERGTYHQRECFVAYAPVASTQWSVLFILPVEEVNAPIRPTERLITSQVGTVKTQVATKISLSIVILVFLCFILVCVVVVVARRLSGIITAPIRDLENGVKVIGEGNLEYRLDIRSGDEIEALAASFNKMTTDLRDYIRNLTETMAAKERIQGELKVATDIQASLLPRIFPPFPERPEVDLYALMDPAKEVGGDFYDFFFIDERRLFFVIGDVSDKGVPAALFMMVSKTLLKTEALRKGTPAEILTSVNNLLYPDNETMMFVTIFCAIVDCETGEVAYSNAGHNPPLLCSPGESARFIQVPPGLVVGAMEDSMYQTSTMFLKPGETLLLYTDGVTEAMNRAAELYGETRLVAATADQQTVAVRDFITAIRSDILAFSDGATQSDDITMLALRYLGGGRQ